MANEQSFLGAECEGVFVRCAEFFPLGRGTQPVDLGNQPPSGPETRPFGLRYLATVNPDNVDVLNFDEIRYDPERQMSVLGTDLLVRAATKENTRRPYRSKEDMQEWTDYEPDVDSD